MINTAQSFLGLPTPFKDYCMIYPPTIKETLENPNFNKYLALFTISQEDIEDEIFTADAKVRIKEGDIPTPYEYLCQVALLNSNYIEIIQEGFKFFTKEELTILPEKGIFLLGNLEEILLEAKDINDLPILPPEDYFEFQNLIRAAMGEDPMPPYDYNKSPRRRQMDAKKRLRDRVKAKQNKKTNSFVNQLASICCMGIGITPLNIGEMSYASISVIMSKYQMKEKYDIDIKSLMAGASSKKIKPKYWMQEENDN